MSSCCPRSSALLICIAISSVSLCAQVHAQSSSSSSSSSPTKHEKPSATSADSGIDAGAVLNGVYRNKVLGLTCKIPAGWVLRTDEMNTRDFGSDESGSEAASGRSEAPTEKTRSATKVSQPVDGRVLLAAFSRPPEARAEDVNASILIAAESAETYPGLKEAAQYFGPITEVAKAQGFIVDEEPYEIAMGTKILVRGDFHKDVGTRVMRQSTLAMLAHGYVVSITVIGGTEDEVEELIDGVSFEVPVKK